MLVDLTQWTDKLLFDDRLSQAGSKTAPCNKYVILSDQRESKDLRTDFTETINKMRRFFDDPYAQNDSIGSLSLPRFC